MNEEWGFTQEEIDRFLSWLHADREAATKCCEEICSRLIGYFKSLGCTKAEDQVKATIHRVIQRLPEIATSHNGDPWPYFHNEACAIYQKAFDCLLSWLHADREEAGKEYEKIRRKLVYFFIGRRCAEPEALADETINRVTWKVPKIADEYVGDPARYFYGVARNVCKELCHPPLPPPPPPSPDPAPIKEVRHQCLEDCLKRLPPDDAELVTEYFKDDRRAKIERHRELADERGLTLNALRLRIHRLLGRLRDGVKDCVAQALGG